jgi:hypothetical protein
MWLKKFLNTALKGHIDYIDPAQTTFSSEFAIRK